MSRIGIIAALPSEAKCLCRKRPVVGEPIEIEQDMLLCLCGMGQAAAVDGARKLRDHNINALISWGTAGAIDDRLKTGDILIADRVIGDNTHFSTSKNWTDRVGEHFSKTPFRSFIDSVASIDGICDSTKKKATLSRRTNAAAVDMESAAVTAAAEEYNIDCLVLRVIVDEADDAIPVAVTAHTDQLGQIRATGFLSCCLRQPRQILAIMKLAGCYKKALNTLQRIAFDLKKRHFFYGDVV